jgi:hypothetical protein
MKLLIDSDLILDTINLLTFFNLQDSECCAQLTECLTQAETHKLVPLEPTEAMIQAALKDRTYYGSVPANYYRAMVKAA